jgi:large subunit ribosomal protein L20
MARVKRGVTSRAKHNKVFKAAKGFYGRRKNTIRAAKAAVDRSKAFAYRDRKVNKRNFRALWIQRINAAVREHGLTYGRFIDGLNKAGIEVDRKVLSDMAIHETATFAKLVEASKKALAYLKEAGTANEFESAVK